MPRRLRFNLAGVPQHIVQRGNNRQATFFADEDYSFYLECLKDAADKYRCEVHADVLIVENDSDPIFPALGGDRFREEIEAALSRRIGMPKRGVAEEKRR